MNKDKIVGSSFAREIEDLDVKFCMVMLLSKNPCLFPDVIRKVCGQTERFHCDISQIKIRDKFSIIGSSFRTKLNIRVSSLVLSKLLNPYVIYDFNRKDLGKIVKFHYDEHWTSGSLM